MGLTSSYKKFYSWAVTFSKLLKKEKETWVPMPFSQRIRMWRKGFWSVTYFRYDLSKYKLDDYISDYADNIIWAKVDLLKNRWDAVYFDNKVLFPEIAKHIFHLPENICLIMEGKMLPISNNVSIKNTDDLLTYLTKKPIIIKPADGYCGVGVYALEIVNDKILFDNKEITREQLEKKLESYHNVLISERINKQHEYSLALYPQTLNTIRILTLKDPDNNEVFIVGAVQRIGTSYSYPADNFHRGGIAANINLETGEMGPAAAIFPVTNNKLKWHDFHPDTNAQIKGAVVPNWNELKTKILSLANDLSFFKIIGWDVAITQDGFTLIEGNSGPDPKIHQIHEPLLINPRVKRFCEYYKII